MCFQEVCANQIMLNNGLDLGLFLVSGQSVQIRDTSESAIYIHNNGPRHIPLRANTPSSNRRHLATIIPRAKLDSGSIKSRKNKITHPKRRGSSKRTPYSPSSLPRHIRFPICYLTISTNMLMEVP
jgi:hypothetical protein